MLATLNLGSAALTIFEHSSTFVLGIQHAEHEQVHIPAKRGSAGCQTDK